MAHSSNSHKLVVQVTDYESKEAWQVKQWLTENMRMLVPNCESLENFFCPMKSRNVGILLIMLPGKIA